MGKALKHSHARQLSIGTPVQFRVSGQGQVDEVVVGWTAAGRCRSWPGRATNSGPVLEGKAAYHRPMVTVVLRYVDDEDRFEAAMARLCVELPGAVITRKTHAAVEAQVEDSQLAALRASSEWTVGPMVYADAKPPRQSLARMRSKLQQRP